jgi:hypothetical protein
MLLLYKCGNNFGNRETIPSAEHSTYLPGLTIRLFNPSLERPKFQQFLQCKIILSRMSPSHMIIRAQQWAPFVRRPASPLCGDEHSFSARMSSISERMRASDKEKCPCQHSYHQPLKSVAYRGYTLITKSLAAKAEHTERKEKAYLATPEAALT